MAVKKRRTVKKKTTPVAKVSPEATESKSDSVVVEERAPLPPDLLRPVEDAEASPQQRARWVRRAFSVRGWPNGEHPGTVRDFLIEHKIPIKE